MPSVFNSQAAINERKRAAAHYLLIKTNPTAKKEPFDFKVYKDESIKLALEKLFHGKCAYCESRYTGLHPVDIEHWRPKSEVLNDGDRKARFGYYWLACDWNNLLPSCIDCNRMRNHLDRFEGETILLGKGNWFPLAEGNERATGEKEEFKEQPLLLNPCEDNPEDYLRLHEEGNVLPKIDETNQPSTKAKNSIRIYGLNRDGLVYERRERSLVIQQKILVIRNLISLLNDESKNTETSLLIEDLLSHELEILNDFQRPEQPFSTMAKQLIEKFIKSLE
jgi:uncharacterized protein (TIGR02646 family)